MSDAENFALSAISCSAALKEFMGPRADDSVQKSQMHKDIALQGYTRLDSYTHDVANKQSLNLLDVHFLGAGIATDLTSKTAMRQHTIKKK